eukprot:GHVO01043960.1.p1 GENE.GHVO01043960.1~~GHVO01043960.1.p1  ORF type:complete len:106 (+),score=3.54 GHVO01043960.1:25-342(+)
MNKDPVVYHLYSIPRISRYGDHRYGTRYWEGELLALCLALNRVLGYRCTGQKIGWLTDSKVLVSWRQSKTKKLVGQPATPKTNQWWRSMAWVLVAGPESSKPTIN